MLASLRIQNIALIEDLSLKLGDGLNILSGETGAGKSIIIDSLNFVLGERADKTLIRNGAERATVEAVFENYLNDDIRAVLDEYGIDVEDILILRRSMTESKNECRINGRQATLSMLKTLSSKLVDIHGQHEHQSLLNVSTHINLLDAYGRGEIAEAKRLTREADSEVREYKREYGKFGKPEERARKIDILEYQIKELKEAELKEGEEDQLLLDRKKFRNAEKIVNAVADASGLLNGGSDGYSAITALNKAINLLNIAGNFDESLLPLSDRLESSKIELKDVAETLNDTLHSLQYDEYSAEKTEKRLELVRSLTRKYGGTAENAIKFLAEAEQEYDTLVNADEICKKLDDAISKAVKKYNVCARELHDLRVKYALSFENAINAQLVQLGMPSARFKVEFADISCRNEEDFSPNGIDSVEFLISANKGEPLKPLAKIISGGEMSRFMLALKNITAQLDNISTMIFDEIDTGISGMIAQVVAEKLYNISVDRQVIAVTHLPQLASMADLHYKIEKRETEDKTVTNVTLLDYEGELQEVARLIGGSTYSEHALPHATSMKEHAVAYKSAK